MSLAISIKVLISKFANLAQVLTAKRNDLQHSWLWAKPPNNWSVLIGFLIEYFNMKRGREKKPSLPHENKTTKGPGDYFRAFLLVSNVLFRRFNISKRETRAAPPLSPGQWEELFHNKHLPRWRGSCALQPGTDTATLKGGWAACLSKFKCLDSKRKQEKRNAKVHSNLSPGFENPSLPGLT